MYERLSGIFFIYKNMYCACIPDFYAIDIVVKDLRILHEESKKKIVDSLLCIGFLQNQSHLQLKKL